MGKPVSRVGKDSHVGHASGTPNPFHRTKYSSGSANVITNGAKTVRKGDKTGCGDPATGASEKVIVNGRGVHRKGDATGGHGSWGGNRSSSGSGNVEAG